MLALIPARGGSKGLPGKNIKLLNGKPLIAWTIEAALSSARVDEVIISTDDSQIASVAQSYGGKVPFLRPSQLAQDNSLAIDNYIYTLDRLNKEMNIVADELVVLQPTSPLRLSEDIDAAIDIFYKKQADSVISVTELNHPVQWVQKIIEDGTLRNYTNEKTSEKNRQELCPAYIPNGAVFVLRHSLLKKKCTYYSEKTYPYIMPRERSVDIDSDLDFKLAELLVKETCDE